MDKRGAAGLCDTCEHARRIPSSKGAEFVMCELSATDDRFRKYPPLPVVRCEGYAPRHERHEGHGDIGHEDHEDHEAN